MLNLIFAPSADVLVPLAGDVVREAWGDPFDPPTIIVPNPAVGKWLTVRLAELPSFGCVANARVVMLEKFLWGALMPDPGMELADGGRLAQVICACLDEGVLGDDIYAPLREYLCGKGGRQVAAPADGGLITGDNQHNHIDALKRVQLSARIAQLFLEYEYNRPSVWNEEAGRWKNGIDAQWLSGREYFGKEPHEAWQMDLYRRVCRPLSKSGGPVYTSLPHLYRRRREEGAKGKRAWCDVGSNPRIILFGVSKISHFHRNTLVEISQADGVDMHVFLTNPCAEFWEDVDTSRRSFKRRWSDSSPTEQMGFEPVRPDDYEKERLDRFPEEKDHALLKLWGSAGKENIFLWCPQAQWNFEYHGDLADDAGDGARPKTLLASIQKSLLRRGNNLDLEFAGNDSGINKSLQILACPDISREVEEVRELILDMAHGKGIDSFNDIAVYMPDPDKYLPQIQRVFGAYSQGHGEYIPFTVLGASCGASAVARGLFALLNIIGGSFNRAQVFELLRNPVVMASKKIIPTKITQWEQWTEEHGMFRGYDAKQRESMGDMGDAVTDEHTFYRGIMRVINSIVDTESFNTSYNKATAEKFLSFLKELNELSALFTKNNRMLDIRESVDTLKNAVFSWFGTIPNDGSVDSAAEARVKREALDGIDLIMLQHTLSGRTSITLDEFIALARGCVPGELAAPSSAWSGVTFAPLRASMVLPHRAIFVLGLDATEFPGTSEKGSWDLLARKRIVGDSDPVRDNRFAFLELMHAAKERLILSYRARDLQKDEMLQPSSVISELEEYLVGQGLTDGGKDSHRSSARREIPWVVRESLDVMREWGRKHGTWDRAERELAVMGMAERVQHRHDLLLMNNEGKEASSTNNGQSSTNENSYMKSPLVDGKGQYCADIRDLKMFFKNPLEYHLRGTLGVGYDDDAGDMSAVNEPVDSGNKLFMLRKKVWIAVLNMIFPPTFGDIGDNNSPSANEHRRGGILPPATSDIIEKIANDIYNEHIDSGQAPEGHIRRMEQEELVSWAKKCAAAAHGLPDDFPNHQLAENSLFTVDCGQFIINGSYTLTLIPKDTGDRSLKIGVLAFNKHGEPGDIPGLWLEGVMMWLAEIRSGDPHPISLVALNHETPGKKSSDMKMDHGKLDEVENRLQGILAQMLIEGRCEHLPLPVIADMVKKKRGQEEKSFGERLQNLTSRQLKNKLISGKGYNPYMDAFKLTDARPPEMPDEALRELVNFRYAPMLERWIHE